VRQATLDAHYPRRRWSGLRQPEYAQRVWGTLRAFPLGGEALWERMERRFTTLRNTAVGLTHGGDGTERCSPARPRRGSDEVEFCGGKWDRGRINETETEAKVRVAVHEEDARIKVGRRSLYRCRESPILSGLPLPRNLSNSCGVTPSVHWNPDKWLQEQTYRFFAGRGNYELAPYSWRLGGPMRGSKPRPVTITDADSHPASRRSHDVWPGSRSNAIGSSWLSLRATDPGRCRPDWKCDRATSGGESVADNQQGGLKQLLRDDPRVGRPQGDSPRQRSPSRSSKMAWPEPVPRAAPSPLDATGLAAKRVADGIVDAISTAHRAGDPARRGLQPHRTRYCEDRSARQSGSRSGPSQCSWCSGNASDWLSGHLDGGGR